MGSSVRGLDFGHFGTKCFAIFFIKKRANDHFSDPPRCAFQKMPFSFCFVFGPHVGPMQTVCPRNGLTEEGDLQAVLNKGLILPLPLWSNSPPALAMHLHSQRFPRPCLQ